MNAAETIQAAIDRLTELRGQSTPAPWQPPDADGWMQGGEGLFVLSTDEPALVYHILYGEPADAELIVTLHRTIDAQLAFLRTVHEAEFVERKWGTLAYTASALTLARAILGGDE